MVLMSHCRAISGNNVLLWEGGNVGNGEAMRVQGQGACGKSLYLPHNFAVNLKWLLIF